MIIDLSKEEVDCVVFALTLFRDRLDYETNHSKTIAERKAAADMATFAEEVSGKFTDLLFNK